MTVEWLLDTNTCIAVMNDRPAKVRDILTTKPTHAVAISAITLFELQYGVHKSQAQQRNQNTLSDFCRYVQVLPWTIDCADIAGELRAELERLGKPIGPFDLLIAAHARQLNATLVTANVREFKRVKTLNVVNWNK